MTLHTQSFLSGLRPWLVLLLCLRLAMLLQGQSQLLWSIHQLVVGLALAAGLWAVLERR